MNKELKEPISTSDKIYRCCEIEGSLSFYRRELAYFDGCIEGCKGVRHATVLRRKIYEEKRDYILSRISELESELLEHKSTI